MVAGGTAVYYYAQHSGHWHSQFDQRRIVQRMARDLKLDDSQTQRVSAILDDYFAKRRELDQKHLPEFDALRQQAREQIRQVLNPEQLAMFNDHVRKMDERMKKQRASGK